MSRRAIVLVSVVALIVALIGVGVGVGVRLLTGGDDTSTFEVATVEPSSDARHNRNHPQRGFFAKFPGTRAKLERKLDQPGSNGCASVVVDSKSVGLCVATAGPRGD